MTRHLVIVAIIAVALGLGALALWHRSSSHIPQTQTSDTDVWCDPAHKIPFIDAEHCGGMTSCDRAALVAMSRGPHAQLEPVPCPE